jgi:hypothetical protein
MLAQQLDRPPVHTLSTISTYAIVAAIIVVLAQSLAAAGRFMMVVARFGPRFALRHSYRLTRESMFFAKPSFRFWAETP